MNNLLFILTTTLLAEHAWPSHMEAALVFASPPAFGSMIPSQVNNSPRGNCGSLRPLFPMAVLGDPAIAGGSVINATECRLKMLLLIVCPVSEQGICTPELDSQQSLIPYVEWPSVPGTASLRSPSIHGSPLFGPVFVFLSTLTAQNVRMSFRRNFRAILNRTLLHQSFFIVSKHEIGSIFSQFLYSFQFLGGHFASEKNSV